MRGSKTSIAIAYALATVPTICFLSPAAMANPAGNIAPEVESRVWQEDSTECAAVTLNGKELVCYRAESGSEAAIEKAEDLAIKLEELLTNKKIDADELLPAKAGSLATIQCHGNTVFSFEPQDTDDNKQASAFESSWKVVNAIRAAYGASLVPESFIRLSGRIGQDALAANKPQGGIFSGNASWYGGKFHGRRTSDGSRYDQEKMTAAHRSLPFGTKLLVMNRKTGNSCVVEINDRGPFVDNRVIDLSRAAARQLNMISSGVALVDCLVLGNQ